MNCFKVISINLILLLLLIPFNLSAQDFGSDDSAGTVTIESNPVWVVRDGRQLNVGSFGLKVKTGDVVKTGENGKAKVSLTNGNNVYVAPSSELRLTEEVIGDDKSMVNQIIDLFYGKIRAKIQKTRKQRFVIKTATATIGVKGTDFIAEYIEETTKVGTVEGLVFLLSEKSQESIDIPPGQMSSVSPAGEIMPLEEFAGELMEGVEFAGKKMTDEEIGGEKIEM
ncbi:FecR family protein [bacterium]|nr:FecR family protein [bacterium]